MHRISNLGTIKYPGLFFLVGDGPVKDLDNTIEVGNQCPCLHGFAGGCFKMALMFHLHIPADLIWHAKTLLARRAEVFARSLPRALLHMDEQISGAEAGSINPSDGDARSRSQVQLRRCLAACSRPVHGAANRIGMERQEKGIAAGQ
jgi:hypothetical protein